MSEAVLKGLNWGHRRATGPMDAAARAFHARGLGRVEWDVQALSGFESALDAALADRYDLIVFDHPFCGLVVEKRLFQPLGTVVDPEDDAAYVGASLASYRYDGHLWALPVDAASQVAIYRPDLLDEPLPADWSQVVALGARARATGRRLALAALNPHGFLVLAAFCANLGGAMPVEEPGDRPFEPDVLREAIARLRELVSLCDPDGIRWNAIDLHEAMAQRDDLVYCPAAFGYLTYAEADRERPLRFADFVSPRGPVGSGAILGGTGLGITHRCADIDAARAFVRLLADPAEHAALIAHHHGQPAMVAAWEDPAAGAVMGDAFAATRASLERASLRPRFIGYIGFQHAAGREVEALLTGDIKEAAFCERLEKAWRDNVATSASTVKREE